MTGPRPASFPRLAAFGSNPEADVRRAAATGSPRDRWLAAVALGGQGRYAAAAGALGELVTAPDPVLAALACSTLAAHRRQLGGHAAARRWDAAALGRLTTARLPAGPDGDPAGDPDGVDLAGAWSDALLGLAADAIGLGRPHEAHRLHQRAQRHSGACWRSRVRAGWVAAEIELAAGHPERAIAPSMVAAELAWAGPSVRHRVKSDIVLGAVVAAVLAAAPATRPAQPAAGVSTVLTDGGHPTVSVECPDPAVLLDRALRTSLERGILTLAWPAAVIARDLHVQRRDEFSRIASDALTSVYTRSDDGLRRLALASPWVPADLIRLVKPTRTGGG
ncbi:MAG TPA: hypothetical protein VG317_03080 [Pseudonocardiaceae bacterium]|nr:hypothetical protein [Pseudonocardiaceae bacterium]